MKIGKFTAGDILQNTFLNQLSYITGNMIDMMRPGQTDKDMYKLTIWSTTLHKVLIMLRKISKTYQNHIYIHGY